MTESRIFLVVLLLVFIVGLGGANFLQRRADATCRARAKDENNVTLCHGAVYAVSVLGDIECGCHRARAP